MDNKLVWFSFDAFFASYPSSLTNKIENACQNDKYIFFALVVSLKWNLIFMLADMIAHMTAAESALKNTRKLCDDLEENSTCSL